MLSRLSLAALFACLLAIGPAPAKSASTENLYQAPGVAGEIGAQSIDASSENAFIYDDCASGESVYNYFRDYNPNTGRYQQSDPIGLRGGVNTYAYVGSRPLSFFDLTGLAARTRPDRWDGEKRPDGSRIYPPGGGLYELRCGDKVMYIGQTGNYRTRYYAQNKPGSNLDQCGCGEQARMVPTLLEKDKDKRLLLEKQEIRKRGDPPPLNRIIYKTR